MPNTSASDLALLTAWRQGDERAGAALLTRHYPGVFQFFRYNIKSMSACDDLVQATFLGLLEGIDHFRGEASFKTFLFAIAYRKLQRYLREQARDEPRRDPVLDSLKATSTPLSQMLARQERNAQLLDALHSLPLDMRVMFELHYWEDLKLKEIAEVMALPVVTVKVRMHRGRKLVLAKLDASA